jgi:hypothetical protein
MTAPRLLELDATRLGEALLTAYIISVQLGHKRVVDTLRDYYHPGAADHEQAFLVDLFTEDTDVVGERWFGGPDGVLKALAGVMRARTWEPPA